MQLSRCWIGCLVLASLAVAAKPGTDAKSYVILAKGNSTAGAVRAVAEAGGTVTAALEGAGVVLARSAATDFESRVANHTDVQGVSLDVKVNWRPGMRSAIADSLSTGTTAAEPYAAYLWNLRQIRADKTAAAGYQGEGAVVAVLDEGIVTDHEDIAPNLDLQRSRSFVPGVALHPTVKGFNHGTHVAGIIAAPINGKGIQGVAPKAKIVAVRVLDETGSGDFGWIFQGIHYATAIGADVINMSLGATFDRVNAGGGNTGLLIATLNRLVNHATQSGTLCVSAAGNEAVDLNSRLWSIPAQSGNGMAVSATGPVALKNFDRLASYSNYGQSVIDVAAPGGDFTLYPAANYVFDMIISPAGPRNAYYFAAGTSMAAPHVSGLAALLVSRYGKLNPAQLRSMIENYAVDILAPGADEGTGRGRIDAARTLGIQ